MEKEIENIWSSMMKLHEEFILLREIVMLLDMRLNKFEEAINKYSKIKK